MKKFIRQTATKAPAADIAIDFGAASEKVARVFEPEVYGLQVKTASVRHSLNSNIFVVLDLVELESGARVSLQPLWVAGPNAEAGSVVAENLDVIAQMLRQAGLETSGKVGELIPEACRTRVRRAPRNFSRQSHWAYFQFDRCDYPRRCAVTSRADLLCRSRYAACRARLPAVSGRPRDQMPRDAGLERVEQRAVGSRRSRRRYRRVSAIR